MHVKRGVAAQRRGQRGDVGGPVAGVGHDDHVGVEFVAVRLDERDEARRAHLLLAFDEHLDIDLELVAERLQRTGVDGDAAAVVGRATAEQAVADLRGHERLGLPHARVRNRLHVMVRIQQYGRGFRIHDARADDLPGTGGAVGVVRLGHLGVDADKAQLLGHEFGGTAHLLAGDAFRGDRLQRDLALDQFNDARPVLFNAGPDLIHVHGCHVSPLYLGFLVFQGVVLRPPRPSACAAAGEVPTNGRNRASRRHRNLQA